MEKNNDSTQTTYGVWILLLLVAIVELFVALDSKFYWHDIRFLYANTEFSLSEIFSGVFNPHQAWMHGDEKSASGFYSSKMLHMAMLNILFASIDPSLDRLAIAAFLSVLVMICTAFIFYYIYLHIFRSSKISLFAVICVLIAPVIPYLAGKILSENSSLFFVATSLLLMLKANEVAGKKSIILAITSGMFLALAGLSRLDCLFGPIGYFVAAFAFPLAGTTRFVVLRNIAIAVAAFFAIYFTTILLSEIQIESINDYFVAFVNAGQKSVLMSLIGVLTMGGVAYVFAVFGAFSEKKDVVRFFLVWLLITAFPIIVVTWSYMVEPRYLIQALIPLCGLGALGVDKLWRKLSITRRRAKIIIITLLIMGSNYILVRLMPYELDRSAMLDAVASIREIDVDASILVPWSYTDYNFLHISEHDPHIFNVNSSGNLSIDVETESQWKARFKHWYGLQYISEWEQLDELMKNRPVYYLGWRKYPPVQDLHNLAARIGWVKLMSLIDGLNLKDHRKESWVWELPELNMRFAGRSGQYEYYLVEYAKNKKAIELN